MATVWDRLITWWRAGRAYEPPPGRREQDPVRRLPSGGTIQRMPGDAADPNIPGPDWGGGRDR
ncbi:hypothetical protein [Leifsonia sp. NPDC080035]|uniref:Uncharacterized protein n=1 Tax=Leifsonia sp. NPDC080035 TaxID=3143936 RepID=A0AAU7GEG5_9MICO